MSKRRKAKSKPSRLGEVLVSHGLITRAQRAAALQKQKHTAQRLGEILVEDGLLTRDELNWSLGNLLGIPYVELSPSMVDAQLVASLPAELLRRCRVVPMIRVGNELTLAMADPTDAQAAADVESLTGAAVRVAMADVDAVAATLDAVSAEAGPAPEAPPVELAPATRAAPTPGELLGDRSGSRLLEHHIRCAYKQGADEILFHPGEEAFRVRSRIHGRLVDDASYPAAFLPTVVARLKLMAKLDLSVGLLFQDGRVTLDIEGKALEILASVYSTVHGPGARIQFQAKRAAARALSGLGFAKADLAVLRRAAAAPAGLIVVCGPVRCGCSTTLYALLREAARADRDIVTLESFAPCRFPDATQLEIDYGPDYLSVLGRLGEQAPAILLAVGLHDRDFWWALRPETLTSTLLLGEMRAEHALAALNLLRENQVGDSVLAASLRVIVAQRLVPALDPRARRPQRLSKAALAEVAAAVPDPDGAEFCRAKTDADGQPIYRGHELIYEILEPGDELRDLLLEGASAPQLRGASERTGMTTLRECALRKAAQGLIELEDAP